MRLEKVPELKGLPPSYKGGCPNPDCKPPYNNVTYIHDIKCQYCDNQTVVYCPNCKNHWKVFED